MVPAVCAGALAAMLALQLAVPRATPLPEPGVVRPFAMSASGPAAIAADPVILARSIFGGDGTAASTNADRPIGGATAIGVLSRRGARIAFVRGEDGAVVSLSPGDRYRGWRLRAVGRDALLFDRGGQSVSLPVTVQAGPSGGALPPGPVAPLASPVVQPRG